MSIWRCPVCGKLRDSGKPCKKCGVDPPNKHNSRYRSKPTHIIIFITAIFFIASLALIIGSITSNKKQQKQISKPIVVTDEDREKLLLVKLDLIKENSPKDFEEIANIYNKLVLLSKGKKEYIELHSMYIKKRNDEREKQLYKKVKEMPASFVEANMNLYRELYDLRPNNKLYKNKFLHYYEKWKSKKQKAECDLELVNWHWSHEHGYVTAEGFVRNISGRKLKGVKALVTWFDNSSQMITSDSSYLEYHVLMPGQTSPFRVMERYNPAMQSASLEFKFAFGDKIKVFKKK
jgi:hypothetical protein